MTIKEAVKAVLSDEEEKKEILANSRGKEREAAKAFYSLFGGNLDLNRIPDWAMLSAIYSKRVLRSIIWRMAGNRG